MNGNPVRFIPVLLTIALLSAGCQAGAVEPEGAIDGFSVRAETVRLVLRNRSPAPIHYVALEQGTAALVDLYFDPTAWPSVGPGGERSIPYPELMGWTPGATHALVYWWTEGRYGDPIVVRLR